MEDEKLLEVDRKLLEDTMRKANFTISQLAERLGLSEQRFLKKLDSKYKSDFNVTEIMKMQNLLSLSWEQAEEIFWRVE